MVQGRLDLLFCCSALCWPAHISTLQPVGKGRGQTPFFSRQDLGLHVSLPFLFVLDVVTWPLFAAREAGKCGLYTESMYFSMKARVVTLRDKSATVLAEDWEIVPC